MKLQESAKNDVPELESAEVFLVHSNLVNKNYQQGSKVLFTFRPDKQFGKLNIVAPYSLIGLKNFNAEIQCIEVWCTDQYNQLLLNNSKRKTSKIWVSQGCEFYNSFYEKWLKDINMICINHTMKENLLLLKFLLEL